MKKCLWLHSPHQKRETETWVFSLIYGLLGFVAPAKTAQAISLLM
jgi:hypothetical protein